MTVAVATTHVNVGSGRYPIAGWTNIDLFCPADIQADFRELHFRGVKEVRMSHLLEHISWRETDAVLLHVKSWMDKGGTLTVEVPDMEAILELGCVHPLWFKYVYGDQSTDGEYHLAGFTAESLRRHLMATGWGDVTVEKFKSVHRGRETMPCLEAKATA